MKTVRGLPRQRRAGRRDRRDRQEHAGARAPRATPRAWRSSTRPSGSSASRRSCARQGVEVQVVVIHEGADRRHQRGRRPRRRRRGRARSSTSSASCRTRRRPRDRRPHAPERRTRSSGGSRWSRASTRASATPSRSCWSTDGDVAWAGAATRIAKNLGVAQRADVKAIVDKANADTAAAAQRGDRQPDGRHPARQPGAPEGVGDGQPRRRRDAREVPRASRPRSRTPAACARTCCSRAPLGGEQPGEITWGEVFAVLPFGNRTVIETLTYAQLVAAFENGFKPPCGDVVGRHRPHAAVLGPEGHVPLQRRRAGDRLDRATARATTPLGRGRHDPDRHQRLHVHGWRRLHGVRGRHGRAAARATCCWTWLIDYIKANSPVAPVVDGRRVGP